MKHGILFLLFFALFPLQSLAWEGVVLSVHDGDSIAVRRVEDGEKVKIRLYGIDAPEMPVRGKWGAQPYCKRSRDFLRALLPLGGRVSVVDMGFDRYERTVAGIVSLPDGKVAQEELLKSGLVWVYPQYCKPCTQWKRLESRAREERRGLWQSRNLVAPWEWRKR